MTTEDIHSLLATFLARRSEYLAFVGHRSANARPRLGETDYLLVWSLLSRLKITTVHVDDATVAALFRQAAPIPGLADVAVNVVEDVLASRGDANNATLAALYLFNPKSRVAPAWLPVATSPGALAFCYGLTGFLEGPCISLLQAVGRGCQKPVYIPLSALAAPLWRATSFLIADNMHRATVEQLVQFWTEAFSGDDLDVLRLAEENLALLAGRAPVDQMQQHVATLEAQLAALRRTAMAQEATITELTNCPSPGVRPATHGNARLRLARQ